MISLSEAAERYTASLSAPRRRGALSPNSQRAYRTYAARASTFFQNTPLSEVRNGRVKAYVNSLRHLSPSSITAHLTTLSAIIGSVKNADGEALFTQSLDKDFLNVPLVKATEQVCATAEEVEGAVRLGLVLPVFLACSGVRISEALALEIGTEGDCYDPQTGEIHIRRTLKTASACRCVLLPEIARVWLNGRLPKSGRLFPQSYQQVHTTFANLGLPNPHAFRRFRVSVLRKARVQEDCLRSLVGHSKKSITDLYSFAATDTNFMKSEIERCGLGFSLEVL